MIKKCRIGEPACCQNSTSWFCVNMKTENCSPICLWWLPYLQRSKCWAQQTIGRYLSWREGPIVPTQGFVPWFNHTIHRDIWWSYTETYNGQSIQRIDVWLLRVIHRKKCLTQLTPQVYILISNSDFKSSSSNSSSSTVTSNVSSLYSSVCDWRHVMGSSSYKQYETNVFDIWQQRRYAIVDVVL